MHKKTTDVSALGNLYSASVPKKSLKDLLKESAEMDEPEVSEYKQASDTTVTTTDPEKDSYFLVFRKTEANESESTRNCSCILVKSTSEEKAKRKAIDSDDELKDCDESEIEVIAKDLLE